MALQDHLLADEMILARCDPFYATSHRVIRYQMTHQGEQVDAVLYARLQSVELARKPRHGLMVWGTIISITGAILFSWGLVSGLFVLLAGVGIILYGGRGLEDHYQLHLFDMTAEEKRLWQVRYRGSAAFIVEVGKRSRRPLIES